MAAHIGDVNQEGENLEDANIPRQERREQTVKETKTGWLEMKDETQGGVGWGWSWGRGSGSSASPLCLDTTEKYFCINYFHLLFVIYKGMNGMKVCISFILLGLQF